MIMIHGRPLVTLVRMVNQLLHEYANLRKQAPHLFETPETALRVEELLEAKNALVGKENP
jgi:hypothetical protein